MSNRHDQTSTALHIFQHKLNQDLRVDAPPSEVRVFKITPDGEVFLGTQPATSYEEALEKSGQLYCRANKNTKRKV